MINVLSLFAGAGGLDLGFIKAGANITFANDYYDDAVETYKNNIGNHICLRDIYKLNPDETEIKDSIDVIVGGYPCLGFTVAQGKNRNVEDEKNFLYLEYLKFVKYFKPKIFVVENVPGMKRGEDFKPFFNKMLDDFRNIDNESEIEYEIENKVLLASNYGVPQKRERIIIIGKRKDSNIKFQWPKKTHTSKKQQNMFESKNLKSVITIKDAIKDLPLEEENKNNNHIWSKHKVKINGYMGNRKLKWNKPSPTITGRGSRTGGPVIHPHPTLERRLSVRECARLQSFPDDIIFEGSMTSGYAQVGNAVPPLLSFRIAQSVISAMGKKPIKYDPSNWNLPWRENIPQIL